MKKIIETFFYNKCPCCKKKGIFVIGKIGYRYNMPCQCKFCGEKFKVNSFSSMILFVMIIVTGLVFAKITKTGFWGSVISILFLEFLLERFMPVEHIKK